MVPFNSDENSKKSQEINFWPLSSPDLNDMDFAIWGILEGKAYQKPHKNLESLKHSLVTAWIDIDADTVCACSEKAHRRLEAVVKAEGVYIEEK